jgi:hypothetical protein
VQTGVPGSDRVTQRVTPTKQRQPVSSKNGNTLGPDTNAIDDLTFLTEDGDEVSPADWYGERVLLVFLRWLG